MSGPGSGPGARRRWPLGLFLLWWAGVAALVAAVTVARGGLPVDYRTYAEAAALAAETGSPHAGAEAARAAWEGIHRAATALFAPGLEGAEAVSGPYLYPPTLALLLPPGPGAALAWLALVAGAAAAFALAWLHWAGARSGWWLVPAALSADVVAPVAGGNAEVLSLALALAACRLLWTGKGVAAGALAALAVLLKPVAAPLVAGFALLALAAARGRGPRLAAIGAACLAGAAVLALEVLRWPAEARAGFLAYLADPMAHQYLALPEALRWPVDRWNRAPLEVLVDAGLAPAAAQAVALALWAAALAMAARLLAGRGPGFAPLFALAFALHFVARPIVWSLPFLDIVVLAAAWPHLGRPAGVAAAAVAAGVAASHWAALGLFAAGRAPGLLTVQTEGFPWESVLLLPAAATLCLVAARRAPPPLDAVRPTG